MARTLSTQALALQSEAPDFTLPDVCSAGPRSLRELASPQGTVVMFICNHCPYVLHVLDGLLQLVRDYQARGIAFVAICSNDVQRYPQDGPGPMREFAQQHGFGFPYLHDETQEVARAYEAACTPDFYLLDGARRLVYRGRMDDSTPGNGRPVTGADLRAALDALLAGRPPQAEQLPSMGCNIKWR